MSNQDYTSELIILYQHQLRKESDSFMQKVLEEALRRLHAGNNPYLVEKWVVKIEKEHRSFNLPNTQIPTMSRLVIAIILFSLAIYHLIYNNEIMHIPYMHFLVFALGGSGLLMLFNAFDRLKKGI